MRTSCATVAAHLDFEAAAEVGHAEVVIEGVGSLASVTQLDAELILPARRDLVEVGEAWKTQDVTQSNI